MQAEKVVERENRIFYFCKNQVLKWFQRDLYIHIPLKTIRLILLDRLLTTLQNRNLKEETIWGACSEVVVYYYFIILVTGVSSWILLIGEKRKEKKKKREKLNLYFQIDFIKPQVADKIF